MAIDLYACLVDVVGLSRTLNCECWDNGQPADYDTSLSGLFASDLVSLTWANSAADCEKGGVWDILATAKDKAIKAFLADMPSVLARYQESLFVPFSGWVGSTKFSDSLSVLTAANFTGIRIKPKLIEGGQIVLRGVSLALANISPNTVVTAYVYSSRDLSTSLGSVAITLVTANAFYSADFTNPIILDLSGKDAEGYVYADECDEFYIVYQMPVGARYVNNPIFEVKAACCGQRPTASRNGNDYPFLQYMTHIDGIENPTISGLEEPAETDSNARGMQLKADYECAESNWLCGMPYDINAIGTGIHKEYAKMIADALYRKMGQFIAEAILDSSNINAITILNAESLMGKRARYLKEYSTDLVWLAQHFPQDLTDCITCKQSQWVGSLHN